MLKSCSLFADNPRLQNIAADKKVNNNSLLTNCWQNGWVWCFHLWMFLDITSSQYDNQDNTGYRHEYKMWPGITLPATSSCSFIQFSWHKWITIIWTWIISIVVTQGCYFFQTINKLKLHEKFVKIFKVKSCSKNKSNRYGEMNLRSSRHELMKEMSNENHQYVVYGGYLL